jgi:flagellar biosynthesis regulator FlbT
MKSIKIVLTPWEAEQLKASLDYLINDFADDVLVNVSNQINEQLKTEQLFQAILGGVYDLSD